ncbi:putative ATP-dependent DNA helicase recG [Paenibacillus sp. 32O-W]|uniref:DNA binding domain-containing protein n=1 Tax=Brevibacillus thermoruber TaxID=33942 RepID=A0A9X3TTH6_9BACL|nr:MULTISPECIES: RNA-binding domain-containing protein [Paenibacillaceae]ALS25851.1 putative ATP-dependent DNA helicase recG [Paenibacillus sp. 32O-W]MDA5109493.1 putative DNA binding domain-containing protein [Brevibacillus thermoruber]
MDQYELHRLLEELLRMPTETEWLEYKEAKTDYDFRKLGKYFSAISNESNMKGRPCGWLVFGVNDDRKIVGTQYRSNSKDLDNLKHEIAIKTSGGLTFMDIHELILPEGRVLLFQIPAAPPGVPTAWEGHYYGRNGSSIVALNLQEIEQIRNQGNKDWSAQICEDATIYDLDPDALQRARVEYKKKYPRLADEADCWDDLTFLNKAKVIIQGKITNAAIILLGKPESEHFIHPAVAKMSWILKDKDNIEQDYEHFGPPFILNTELVFSKIRNLKYRYMPDNSLFPIEVNQYDAYVIREALHNCIAHQDYKMCGRINIVEKPDELIFTNLGSFIPKSVEEVIKNDSPPEYYRNRFLAEAMVNLNMIDTIGSGIKRMFFTQKKRFFPLPDYDLSDPNKVQVRIIGKILDENYTRMLINHTELDLTTVMLLDKVQKKEKITQEEAKNLRKQRLIEGKYPNIYVAAQIAAITGDKTTYIKNRAFDKDYYKNLIIKFLEQYHSASRQDIDNLLLDKLSDTLNEVQKRKKVNNLLFEMSKKDGTIVNTGSSKRPKWVLT